MKSIKLRQLRLPKIQKSITPQEQPIEKDDDGLEKIPLTRVEVPSECKKISSEETPMVATTSITVAKEKEIEQETITNNTTAPQLKDILSLVKTTNGSVNNNLNRKNNPNRKSVSLEKFKHNLRRGLAAAASAGKSRLDKHTERRRSVLSSSTEGSSKATPALSSSSTCSTLSLAEDEEESKSKEITVPHHGPKTTRNSLQLSDSLTQWLICANALWKSHEMHALRQQTFHVTACAQHTAIQTILLPLTIVSTTNEILFSSQTNGRESLSIMEQLFALPGQTVGLVGNVTTQVACDLLSLIVPVPKHQRRTHQLEKNGFEFLDRLKLTYGMENASYEDAATSEPKRQSNFLLRAGDLSLFISEPEKGSQDDACLARRTVSFVDLAENGNNRLVEAVLDQLVAVGLSLLSNHPTVRLQNPEYQDTANQTNGIEWHCHGGTKDLVRKMTNQTTLERLLTLQKSSEPLVWSGKFHDKTGFGRHFPLYLARGMVPLSPLELLELLWDDSRTCEYNHFCLGRKTILNLDQRPEPSCHDHSEKHASNCDADSNRVSVNGTGTKTIQSETKVPLTSFTVEVSCLMHCRPLPEPDHGYVIVSRSLCQGPAGTSYCPNAASCPSKSEQLWGINVIRRVPGHPDWADLAHLSQVGYPAGLPHFLASQIALKSVQEFFTNVRRSSSVNKKSGVKEVKRC